MTTHLPALPLELDGERLVPRGDIPTANADGADILEEIGFLSGEIQHLRSGGIIG